MDTTPQLNCKIVTKQIDTSSNCFNRTTYICVDPSTGDKFKFSYNEPCKTTQPTTIVGTIEQRIYNKVMGYKK